MILGAGADIFEGQGLTHRLSLREERQQSALERVFVGEGSMAAFVIDSGHSV